MKKSNPESGQNTLRQESQATSEYHLLDHKFITNSLSNKSVYRDYYINKGAKKSKDQQNNQAIM